jgi:hypothetical protein
MKNIFSLFKKLKPKIDPKLQLKPVQPPQPPCYSSYVEGKYCTTCKIKIRNKSKICSSCGNLLYSAIFLRTCTWVWDGNNWILSEPMSPFYIDEKYEFVRYL